MRNYGNGFVGIVEKRPTYVTFSASGKGRFTGKLPGGAVREAKIQVSRFMSARGATNGHWICVGG